MEQIVELNCLVSTQGLASTIHQLVLLSKGILKFLCGKLSALLLGYKVRRQPEAGLFINVAPYLRLSSRPRASARVEGPAVRPYRLPSHANSRSFDAAPAPTRKTASRNGTAGAPLRMTQHENWRREMNNPGWASLCKVDPDPVVPRETRVQGAPLQRLIGTR